MIQLRQSQMKIGLIGIGTDECTLHALDGFPGTTAATNVNLAPNTHDFIGWNARTDASLGNTSPGLAIYGHRMAYWRDVGRIRGHKTKTGRRRGRPKRDGGEPGGSQVPIRIMIAVREATISSWKNGVRTGERWRAGNSTRHTDAYSAARRPGRGRTMRGNPSCSPLPHIRNDFVRRRSRLLCTHPRPSDMPLSQHENSLFPRIRAPSTSTPIDRSGQAVLHA